MLENTHLWKEKLESVIKAGIHPIQTGIIHTGSGVTKYAYLDTLKEAGFIFELIESRAFGVSVGMPQGKMKIDGMAYFAQWFNDGVKIAMKKN